MAGVIAPERDRVGTSKWNFEARDLEVELVSEALEALTYFLEDAIAIPGPKSRDIIGADGAVSISSYAGGGPSSKTSQIIYQY